MKRTHATEVIDRLRQGKRELRRGRVAMTLPEKVRQVVQLQEFHTKVVGKRRPLGPIERPWRLRER